MRRCERDNSADTKVREEGGGGGAPGARAEIPLQPVVKTMVRQAVPLQPMEGLQWSRYPPAACGGPHAGAGGCPKEAVTLWKAHAGAGSWQDLWTHGKRSPRWSRFAGRICWQGQPTTLLEGGKSRSSWPRHGGCSGNRNVRGRFQGAVGSCLGKLATEERNQNRNSKKIEHLTPRGTDNTGHRPM